MKTPDRLWLAGAALLASQACFADALWPAGSAAKPGNPVTMDPAQFGTLGITQAFLDAPRAKLFTSTGADIIMDTTGRAGFNGCVLGSAFTDPAVNYYANVRGQPAHARDACLAVNLAAGVYTFSVTPSIPGLTTTTGTSAPSSGEILFEVILAPN